MIIKPSSRRGFTLIEVLVVCSIIALVSTTLIVSFSSSNKKVNRTAHIIEAAVRDAQARAISSASFQNLFRCGYGLTPGGSNTNLILYAGPSSSTVVCGSQNRNYSVAEGDVTVEVISLPEMGVVLNQVSPGVYFSDIFFEPPTPTTYINNTAGNSGFTQILLGPNTASCAQDPAACSSVCIYRSGGVKVAEGAVCP